ncbi:MAG: glycosyltransferase family 2 protein [Leptolyngbyaceae cyanobacterium bins.349]|nr:glycosyltransferase family 2 protein [Leptolyngbyaceae cyanobacterium bins.349]
MRKPVIAVVIPCYKTKPYILAVIAQIDAEVDRIYVIDDACPQQTGNYVKETCGDRRVSVVFHAHNQGVGGAVVSGYQQALQDGATIIVKLDGDGQMNPKLIPQLIRPILNGRADYAKGNRFFDLRSLHPMPTTRLIGNTGLSFINKLCSGYWQIMDPTNGFTAIHAQVLTLMPLHKLSKRYFFESDVLFRLSTIRAVVYDVPMQAKYDGEVSSLNISRVFLEFPGKYANRFFKRIFYTYFLRDFNAGSLQLVVGLTLISVSSIFGMGAWHRSIMTGIPATSGTVMLASLPIILGFQALLAALNYDVVHVPKEPLHLMFDEE